MWMLLQICLQNGKLDCINLRRTARNGTENVRRHLLVERQFTDQTVPRCKAQGEHTPRRSVFDNKDMPRAHDVKIARRRSLTKKIRTVMQ